MRNDIYEATNEHGFPQASQDCGEGKQFPVCPDCYSMVMPNKGQGMLCECCSSRIMAEMALDDF